MLVACEHVHHNFAWYISLVYTSQHVYESLFDELKNKSTGLPTLVRYYASLDVKRTLKERSKSSSIRNDMDIRK